MMVKPEKEADRLDIIVQFLLENKTKLQFFGYVIFFWLKRVNKPYSSLCLFCLK